MTDVQKTEVKPDPTVGETIRHPVEVREIVSANLRCVRDADGSVWFESWIDGGRLTRVPADEHVQMLQRLRENPRDLRYEEQLAATTTLLGRYRHTKSAPLDA